MSDFRGTLTGTLSAQDSLGDLYDATATISLGVDLTMQSGGVIDASVTLSGNVYQTNHYYNGTSYSFTQAVGPYHGSGVTNISNFNVPLGPLDVLNGVTLTEIATLGSDQLGITATANFNYPRTVYPNGITTQITYYGSVNLSGTLPAVACFVSGTRLLGERGAIAVEALSVGERLVVTSGALRSVRWIGSRTVNCAAHPDAGSVLPVKVCASAFGPGLPLRDLLLSPDHSVFAVGVLIPIRYLINGRTVVQTRMDRVTYYHVELACHDVILAEGLPCESYLDTGNRAAFASGGDRGDCDGAGPNMLHPDFALKVWETKSCAELVLDGPKLEAVKTVVLRQAEALGHRVTGDPGLAVVVDGRTLPTTVTGKTWRVRLPPTARHVRLVSRKWVPAHTGPTETDNRLLGVAIANVRLAGRKLPLEDPRFCSGWHASEPAGGEDTAAEWRWTDGDAVLRVADADTLAFDMVVTGHYWEASAGSDAARMGQR